MVNWFKFKAKSGRETTWFKKRKNCNESVTTGGFWVEIISYQERPDSHLLEEEDDPLDHFGSLLLQVEEGARCPDEDLGLAVGHIVVKSTPLQEPLHCVFV